MSDTIADRLRQGTERLAAAGVVDANRDCRRLMAAALSVDPSRITLLARDPFPASAASEWQRMIDERQARRPVSQILGHRSFFGRQFSVTGDVLDPRPETETLVLEALKQPAQRVLDIGVGSGCILLTLLSEWVSACGVGSDASEPALQVSRANAATLGLQARATFVHTDWAKGIEGSFDLIVSNPPYIAEAELAELAPEVTQWEPNMALSPGADGLAAYRAILPQAASRLEVGGRLLFEIGATQGPDVAGLAEAAGFHAVHIIPDLDGRDRVVAARWQGT